MNPLKSIIETGLNGSSKNRKVALQKLKILQRIFENDAMTMSELTLEVGLSLPTLSSLVVELVDAGLVVQHEKGESVGGRKPALYQLKQQIFNTLCVEIDRFSVRIIVLDNNNNIVYPPKHFHNEIGTESKDAEKLLSIIEQYSQEVMLDWSDIWAIGVFMPGLVNPAKGTNETFYIGQDFNLLTSIQERFQRFVTLLNDVKAVAISELIYGSAQGKKNALVILMDWGIGLGIITDGQVYMGNNGFSGEMGHLVFEDEGKLCYCGKRGCLETIASGLSLVKKAQNDIQNGTPTLLKKGNDLANLLPQHIIDGAIAGDQYAIDLISDLGIKLGKAMSMLIQIFNPETIVLSGKFATAGNLITIPIQQSINSYSMNAISKNCEVLVSTLNKDEHAYGIARYTLLNYIGGILQGEQYLFPEQRKTYINNNH